MEGRISMTNRNAASKTRKCFLDNDKPMTITDIRLITGLESSSVSMAVNLLFRQGYLSRTKVPTTNRAGNRQIWQYKYHPDRDANA